MKDVTTPAWCWLVASLRDPASRAMTLRRLAQDVAARDLLILCPDPETSALIPPPGSPPVLWGESGEALVRSVAKSGHAAAQVAATPDSPPALACGWRAEDGSVVVALGGDGSVTGTAPPWLQIIPLLAHLFALERIAAEAEARRRSAEGLAIEMGRLAESLEAARNRADREVAERARTQQALLARTADLERAVSELEQFAFIVSHDLQEPARMVTQYLDLVRLRYGEQMDPLAQRYIANAHDGAMRMSRLLGDLLQFTRVGAVSVAARPISLRVMVEEIRSDLTLAVAESGGAIETAGADEIVADDSSIRLILLNLIGNALKFRGERPPRVSVSVTDDERAWTVSVSDNGIGIPAQYQSQVFEIFRRLHGRDRYPGTGIGLATCKKLVERAGGRIWVATSSPEGTTFAFTVPKPP
jgi:signal transduction histidine kinase